MRILNIISGSSFLLRMCCLETHVCCRGVIEHNVCITRSKTNTDNRRVWGSSCIHNLLFINDKAYFQHVNWVNNSDWYLSFPVKVKQFRRFQTKAMKFISQRKFVNYNTTICLFVFAPTRRRQNPKSHFHSKW